jgi:hypothetical protein
MQYQKGKSSEKKEICAEHTRFPLGVVNVFPCQELLLAHDPHVVPVILEFLAAVQADYVMITSGSRHIPVRVHRSANRGRSSKGLRNLLVGATDRKELENLVYHDQSLEPSGKDRVSR